MEKQEMIDYHISNDLKFPELDKTTICEFWEKYGGGFLQWLSQALIINHNIFKKIC